MATRYAVANGNWSSTSTWNGGTLPTSVDDVYTNGFIVDVDGDYTVNSVRNGSLASPVIATGGYFKLLNGVTFTVTKATDGIGVGSTTPLIQFMANSPATATINGDSSHLIISSGTICILNSGTGTLTINGTTRTNTFNGNDVFGVLNSSSGTIYFNGTYVIANVSGARQSAINNSSNGTVYVTGDFNMVSTGTGSQGPGNGIRNSGSGTVYITGNVPFNAGSATNALFYAIHNESSGSIYITGNVNGSNLISNFNAVNNSSSGLVDLTGTVQAGTSGAAIGYGSAAQRTLLTGPLLSTDATFSGGATPSGVNPCIAARWFPKETALGTFLYRVRGENIISGERPARPLYFIQSYSSTYPSESDVRLDVSYAPENIYTGTCAVPDASSVLVGVPIDDTFGTYVSSAADFWNAPVSGLDGEGSIGERLKNVSTVQTTGAQIAALGS